MANNCLVTKLKAVVENDNLLKLGELLLEANVNGESNYNMRMSTVMSFVKDLDGHLLDINHSDIGDTVDLSPGYVSSFIVPQGHRIKIGNKLDLKLMQAYYLNSLPFDFEQLAYMPELKTITSEFYGSLKQQATNIESLSIIKSFGEDQSLIGILEKLPNLSSLSASRISQTINLGDIAGFPNITNVGWGENTTVSKFEDVIVNCLRLSTPRFSGEISFTWTNNVKFKGSIINIGGTSKTLSWSSSNGVTSVTFDGVTVTFDGTNWKDENGNIYTP